MRKHFEKKKALFSSRDSVRTVVLTITDDIYIGSQLAIMSYRTLKIHPGKLQLWERWAKCVTLKYIIGDK